jgi:hypothetical protein
LIENGPELTKSPITATTSVSSAVNFASLDNLMADLGTMFEGEKTRTVSFLSFSPQA